MRKTVTITIGGSIFHIEEQAFEQLDAYLRSIRDHFASYEDHEEIVSDIESRMAEEFTDALKGHKRAAITESDVTELMKRMGTVEDFAAFEGEARTPEREEPASSKKRLYRNPDNVYIAGVASGIANYFQIDPVIVRLIFIASLFFGGAGVLVYIVLWIVMPEAKTPSERAEMRGQPLTIKRIEATIREAIPDATKNIKPGTFSRIIRFPFLVLQKILHFIARILKTVVPVLGRVLGFVIMMGTVAALLFLTFWFIMLMTSSWEQYMDIPVRELAGNFTYYTTLVTGYVVAFIPLVMILGIGTSLLQMKNAFHFHTVMILLGIWMVAVTSGAVVVARELPAFHDKIEDYLTEHEAEMQRDIPVSEFHAIDAAGSYEVRVRKGTDYTMTVRGPQAALEKMKVAVDENGVLTIQRNNDRNRFCIFCIGSSSVIDITMPSTLGNVTAQAGTSFDISGVTMNGEKLEASGGAHISVTDVVTDRLNVDASAGSRIEIDAVERLAALMIETSAGSRVSYNGEADTTTVKSYAGSRVLLQGSGTTLTAELAAGSELTALKFPVRDASIEAYAGGNTEVTVSGTLSGSASAGGSIRYMGTPTVTITESSSGYVEQMHSEDDSYQYDAEEDYSL